MVFNGMICHRMEATATQQRGSTATRRLAGLMALFLFVSGSEATAQVARVTTRDGDPSATWNFEETVFDEVRWQMQNARWNRGCVVEWSITPFRHAQAEYHPVDSQMQVRLLNSRNSRRWRVTTASDRTHAASGDDAAHVSVSSRRRGTAVVGLAVSFLPDGRRMIPEGNYQAVVTSTISGL